jgi:hypothetical protein
MTALDQSGGVSFLRAMQAGKGKGGRARFSAPAQFKERR